MEVNEDECKAFIGKKADYYIEKWSLMEKACSKISWNWGAFLLGLLWMLYRKMYFYSLIVLGIAIGQGIITELSGLGKFFDLWLVLIISLLFGLFGNYLYYIHTKSKILKIKRTAKEELLVAELVRKGGTTWAAPIIFVFMYLLIIIISL